MWSIYKGGHESIVDSFGPNLGPVKLQNMSIDSIQN